MATSFHTREEEYALIVVAQAGYWAEDRKEAGTPAPFDDVAIKMGVRARNELIVTNEKYIWRATIKNAARYSHRTQADDLIYFATIGYLRAIVEFDFERGTRLNTYANWWIFNQIQHELTGDPRSNRRRMERNMLPLDNLIKVLKAPPTKVEEHEHVEYVGRKIHEAIGRLPENWQFVMRRRLEGKTHLEISIEIGTSRSRIGQLEEKARKAMRKHLETDKSILA